MWAIGFCLWLLVNLCITPNVISWNIPKGKSLNRRKVLTTATLTFSQLVGLGVVKEADASTGLADKLSRRDPAALRNSVFNIPPGVQIYPEFMKGEWKVNSRFNGYIFPSTTVPKSKLVANYNIPGFQKCSIAATSDVGRESVEFTMKIDPKSGAEDRVYNLESEIDAYLGRKSVKEVKYAKETNPNRISISFLDGTTRNAEQIELFCNGRESQQVPNPNNPSLSIFVCSEYIRQVTFSYSQEFGVARQVSGNYAHFWTWKEEEGNPNRLTGNLLTAVYLDAQDPLFFDEPAKPVAVYSHVFTATRSS